MNLNQFTELPAVILLLAEYIVGQMNLAKLSKIMRRPSNYLNQLIKNAS